VLFGKDQGLLAFGHDKQRAAQENAPYWASSWLETLFSSALFLVLVQTGICTCTVKEQWVIT
jgi:hypothetical protein